MVPTVWPLLALGVILLLAWLGKHALATVAPKVTAIALVTAKETLAQPVFYVALGIGGFLVALVFPFIPYNTFGEDIKMLKDSGLTLIMLLSILVALWTASVTIADEIEGRTALTLLSKPVGRLQFIVGKFVGVLLPVALLFLLLGVLFLGSISYKVVYDARENSSPIPTVHECRAEMGQIVPGMVLSFMETIVLTAISVAISTRLPMLPNLIICSTVYVLGHLAPLIVGSPVGENAIVSFVAQLIAVVLPVLDHFNIQAAVATGQSVPASYLAWTTLYCALYTVFALLAALLLFEDRDLA
jgi:ABC-type transport system involved in multi-copper enzyme maturation permease subunit